MADEEPQRQLHLLIREFSAEKTNGEHRISDLKKRLLELQTGYETASAELEKSKRAREAAERELRRSQALLTRISASLVKMESKNAGLQNEISQVSSELHAIKDYGEIQRDEFIRAMQEFNRKIRQFNDMTLQALKKGQPHISTDNDQEIDFQSEKNQENLENEILSMNVEMHRLEHQYQKMVHDVNNVHEELTYFKMKVSLSEAIVLQSERLKDLSSQISELENSCSSLGEELQRRYICPKCLSNNMEASEWASEAGGTPTTSTGVDGISKVKTSSILCCKDRSHGWSYKPVHIPDSG